MIRAYPTEGFWRLVPERRSETFCRRAKIKALGGIWDGRFWDLPNEDAVDALGAVKMYWVNHGPNCHEGTGQTWATESELAMGKMRLGCGICDTRRSCGAMVEIWVSEE